MNKFIKTISVIFVSLLLCLLSYKFCFFIADKYFFDKLIYRKSIAHGYHNYFSRNKLFQHPPFFGDRNKDIIALKSDKTILKNQKYKNHYKIAIIGDSYVWGTGIRNNQRFSKLLETKLNKIRPTKIISAGEPGNGTLDYLRWYDEINSREKIDFYIFSLVTNDIYVDFPSLNFSFSDYRNIINTCQTENHPIKAIGLNQSIDMYKSEDQGLSSSQIYSFVSNLQSEAWKNPTNICILTKSLSLLPSDNSIYFFPTDYFGHNLGDPDYTQLLEQTNKKILSSLSGKNISQYTDCWQDDKIWEKLQVSQKEKHPNNLANQIYADILYQEIITNPQWRFIK